MNPVAIEQLVAHAAPSRLPVSTDDDREQRNWVIRLAADLADPWNADDASTALTNRAASAVHEARKARGIAPDDGGEHVPIVRLVPIDGRHLVMNVTTIKLEHDDAHAYLVAASAALRALDEMNSIDDIQGIPRRFWGP